MENYLWQECINCKDKCCDKDITCPLFATPEDRARYKNINTRKSCIFFNENKLCDIYKTRPFDCRFFPFELMIIDSKFYWIIWNISCPIIENRRNDFEKYLEEHENNLIPKFIDYLKDYADFRLEELKKKYKYEIIREAKIRLP